MTDATRLPEWAISVRQPWAWAIVHGGKDIENRSPAAVRNMGHPIRGRFAVHASKGMTRDEYISASDFMQRIGVACPPAGELLRGGIIGSVEVVEIVSSSISPWFSGPRGLVLRDAWPCALIPAVGALGIFSWQEADPSIVPAPARWMLPKPAADQPRLAEPEAKALPDLFRQPSEG
jgi:hypothetical protein